MGHWSCFLLARLSSWIYVIWPCLRQPLKDISLLGSEERQDCSTNWASSMGGKGQGITSPRLSMDPQVQIPVLCAPRWLMWTFCSRSPRVDAAMWCAFVCVHGSLQLWVNLMQPLVTAALLVFVNQHKGPCLTLSLWCFPAIKQVKNVDRLGERKLSKYNNRACVLHYSFKCVELKALYILLWTSPFW